MTADEKKKADEQQKVLVQKNNAAVDELQAVVGRFNEQLKIFKAKQKRIVTWSAAEPTPPHIFELCRLVRSLRRVWPKRRSTLG